MFETIRATVCLSICLPVSVYVSVSARRPTPRRAAAECPDSVSHPKRRPSHKRRSKRPPTPRGDLALLHLLGPPGLRQNLHRRPEDQGASHLASELRERTAKETGVQTGTGRRYRRGRISLDLLKKQEQGTKRFHPEGGFTHMVKNKSP